MHVAKGASVLLISHENWWDWAEVRGHLEEAIGGDEARSHIDELSQKYLGHPYQPPIGPKGRVILRIAPDRVVLPKSRRR